jgi:allophanate hydrolase
MVALEGAVPRPGLIRQPNGSGSSLEVEVHELSHAALGSLMVSIKPPLAIGTVTLDDGRELPGFVCEGHAAAWAPDVTDSGGWRAHLRRLTSTGHVG